MNRFICRTQTWNKFYLCSFGFGKRNCSYKICALCHFPSLLTSELTVAICKNYYSCYHFALFATSARPAASRFCMIHGAASGEQMVSFHGEERERRRGREGVGLIYAQIFLPKTTSLPFLLSVFCPCLPTPFLVFSSSLIALVL